jgi:hypothetical protein
MHAIKSMLRDLYDENPSSQKASSTFHRLSKAVDELDREKPAEDELKSLCRHFHSKANISKSQHDFGELTLVAHHLEWLMALKLDSAALPSSNPTANTSASGILSKSLAKPKHDDTLIFYLPSNEAATSRKYETSISQRSNVFDTKVAQAFFEPIASELLRFWPKQLKPLVGRAPTPKYAKLRSLLTFAHWQLLQNTLTHALAEPTFNRNYVQSWLRHYSPLAGTEYLFGSISALVVEVLDPSITPQNTFNRRMHSISGSLSNVCGDIYLAAKNSQQAILVLSYIDTGPGIERHIRHFSPRKAQLPKTFDTKFVIENRVSGRDILDSGNGLQDICQLASEAGAIIVFETPESQYALSRTHDLNSVTSASSVPRGTSVTILLQV